MKKKKPPILPRQVVQFAWGLTIEHSSARDVDLQAKEIRDRMDEIKSNVYKTEDKKDILYIDNIYPAIANCVRTLLIIIRGRNTNFEETDSLSRMYIKNIESISRFTLDLQSAVGRITTMTFGGSSVGVILAYFFPNLPAFFLPFAVATAAAGAYALHELIIKPINRGMIEKVKIQNDYKRNLYYQQYVRRSKIALTAVFEEALYLYEEIYKDKYDKKYDNKANREKFIENMMKSLEFKFTCEYIHDCYADKIFLINKERWETCESGEGCEKCDEWKRRARR